LLPPEQDARRKLRIGHFAIDRAREQLPTEQVLASKASEQARQKSINCSSTMTVPVIRNFFFAQFLKFGLKVVGFDLARQRRTCATTNIERFRAAHSLLVS